VCSSILGLKVDSMLHIHGDSKWNVPLDKRQFIETNIEENGGKENGEEKEQQKQFFIVLCTGVVGIVSSLGLEGRTPRHGAFVGHKVV